MTHAAIAAEILEMTARDQAMRRAALSGDAEWDRDVDRANTSRLRDIVDAIGWAAGARRGGAAEHAAWLLAQHSDQAVDFQKRCLDLMRSEPADEVCARHLAYLEDRIAVKEGLPQRFGTQLRGTPDTGYVPLPLAEYEHVDELRASVGLEPLADYLRRATVALRKNG